MTVMALCWHPGSTSIQTAGGFKRFYEILKRAKKDTKVIVVDKYPSIYQSLSNQNITILEYGKGINFNWITDRLISTTLIITTALSQKSKPEIIYVPFSEIPQLSLSAVVLKNIYKCKLIFCNLNVNTLLPDKLLNYYLHKLANKVITLSQALKNDLAKAGIKATEVNGVGFEKMLKPKKTYKHLFEAIYIGRHTPEKGFFDLIDIWKQLINVDQKKYKLVTVGDVPEVYKNLINDKIRSANLSEYIKIIGNVSDAEKIQKISQSKVCVFPSHNEGWGIVPMEALSLGIPTIAYNLPVYRESITKSQSFITIPKGDTLNFSRTIIDVVDNLNSYTVALKKWKPKVTWDSVANKEWKIICQT